MSRVLDLRAAAKAHVLPLSFDPSLAGAARATWLGRMINEHESARVFEALAGQLGEAGFGEDDVAACRQFSLEERHHGVLCGAVVTSLGGEARAAVPDPTEVPRHRDVSRMEAVLRNLLSVSCLSETVAVALIGAERHEMPEGALRALLTRIWADEVGHARFGWRVIQREVPRLCPTAKERLSTYLAVALAHVEAHELSHLPLRGAPEGGEALGLCSGFDARALFYETIEQVILPGLEQVGLDAKRAWSHSRRVSRAA